MSNRSTNPRQVGAASRVLPSNRVGDPAWVGGASARPPPAAAAASAAPPHPSPSPASPLAPSPPRRRPSLLGRDAEYLAPAVVRVPGKWRV